MWPVGTKIECIYPGGRKGHLRVGRIHRVSPMCPVCAGMSDDENKGYVFIDIVGEPHPDGTRCNAWLAAWFRPVVERKTDIAIFTAMLTPVGKKEQVNAQA